MLRALFITRGTQIVSCGMRISVADFILSNILFLIARVITLANVSGADGLVKLWTVKSNECVATYDHHEDKVPVEPLLCSSFSVFFPSFFTIYYFPVSRCIYLEKCGSNVLHA